MWRVKYRDPFIQFSFKCVFHKTEECPFIEYASHLLVTNIKRCISTCILSVH